MYACMHACALEAVCVQMCECKGMERGCERERERKTEKERERERDKPCGA